MKKELQMRLAVAKFMQESLEQMAVKKKSSKNSDQDASGAQEVQYQSLMDDFICFSDVFRLIFSLNVYEPATGDRFCGEGAARGAHPEGKRYAHRKTVPGRTDAGQCGSTAAGVDVSVHGAAGLRRRLLYALPAPQQAAHDPGR